METLCTSFWFWFVILGSMGVAVIAAFYLGRDLGVRTNDLIWKAQIRALYDRQAAPELITANELLRRFNGEEVGGEQAEP